MEVQIFDYCGSCKEKLSELGFEHKEIINVSQAGFWGTVERLHRAGMDVMVRGGDLQVIFVDKWNGKFRMR